MDRTLGYGRRLVLAFVVFSLAVVGPVAHRVAAFVSLPSADGDVVVWHIPHPDDETIGMGDAIATSVAMGHRNVVVLYTNGEASDVRHVLNGLLFCRLHDRFHAPEEEGYAPMSKEAFGQARLLETSAALTALGVNPGDIIAIGLPDDGITVDEAYGVLRDLDEQFPLAAHRTTSLFDTHPDHRQMARAMNRFVHEKRTKGEAVDVVFYGVYAHGWPDHHRDRPFTAVAVNEPAAKARALAEFALWSPEQGRFAIGMHSVPLLLERAASHPWEYVHAPPANFNFYDFYDPQIAFAVFPHKVGVHWRITPSIAVRINATYAGTVAPPTVMWEAPTALNAAKIRLGAAPSSWAMDGIDITVAGLRLFNHWLIEYAPAETALHGKGAVYVGYEWAW